VDDFDYEIAIGNLVMLHQPERWERLRRNLRYQRTGRGGRMRCKCGYVTGSGERFEYHQGREVISALRKLGFEILPPARYGPTMPLRLIVDL
jgi:hypothetical protein